MIVQCALVLIFVMLQFVSYKTYRAI